MLRAITLFTLILISTDALTCDRHGKSGLLPENDMYIGVYDKSRNGEITEKVFNDIIDKAVEHYEPIVAQTGNTLTIHKKWQNGAVNAYAVQFGSDWDVYMLGGLARHHLISADGFALAVCHELGHHLGGAPKNSGWDWLENDWVWLEESWSSVEGQSDYWASLKCFRRIFKTDDNEEIVAIMDVDEIVHWKCDLIWDDPADAALCKRSAQAAKGLGTFLNSGRPVSFDMPDTHIVQNTSSSHPHGQCRLDTYFAASLCTKDTYSEIDNSDPTVGVCNRYEGFKEGIRPLCWYKPNRVDIQVPKLDISWHP